jgi:hypothetical protein
VRERLFVCERERESGGSERFVCGWEREREKERIKMITIVIFIP